MCMEFRAYGRDKNTRKSLVQTLEGKRSLGRSTHRWKGNIKMDVKRTGCKGVYCIHMVHDKM